MNEDGLRALAVAMMRDAVKRAQVGGGVPRAEAIAFLRCRGAREIMDALGIDQDVVLERLGLPGAG
jgi:hypothetical protein